jgi:hypothetical protein
MQTRKLLFGAAFIAFGLGAIGTADAAIDPIRLYGDSVVFDVVRNGDTIGSQEVAFQADGDNIRVTETSDIEVKILFVPVYHFHYHGIAIWHDGALLDLQAKIDDGGKAATVTAKRIDDHLAVKGPKGAFNAATDLVPVTHWDKETLKRTTLLNSIEGKIEHVEVTDEGPDTVKTIDGTRAAHRFVYRGDIKLTAWYDSEDRWVGLSLKGKDGSTIDYVCRRCGPSPAK